MDAEESLRYKLINTSAITAYTSNRVYPLSAPQAARLPHVTYSLVADVPHHAMQADCTLREAQVQVSSWSTAYSQVKGLSKAVKTALRDFTGTISSGITVQRIFYDGAMDVMEIDPETKAKTYHIPQDFIVWYTT